MPGFHIDLRHDFINQNQLRQGNSTAGGITLPATVEIERKTTKNYTTLGLDYTSSAHWGVLAQLPYVNRSHTTFAAGDKPRLFLNLTPSARLYGYMQLPAYQHVEGLQLAPRWNASLRVNLSLLVTIESRSYRLWCRSTTIPA